MNPLDNSNVNFFEQVKNYVTEGKQIGGSEVSSDASAAAKIKAMSHFPQAIFKSTEGKELSTLQKIANAAFFGFNVTIGLPFFAGNAAAMAVIKHQFATEDKAQLKGLEKEKTELESKFKDELRGNIALNVAYFEARKVRSDCNDAYIMNQTKGTFDAYQRAQEKCLDLEVKLLKANASLTEAKNNLKTTNKKLDFNDLDSEVSSLEILRNVYNEVIKSGVVRDVNSTGMRKELNLNTTKVLQTQRNLISERMISELDNLISASKDSAEKAVLGRAIKDISRDLEKDKLNDLETNLALTHSRLQKLINNKKELEDQLTKMENEAEPSIIEAHRKKIEDMQAEVQQVNEQMGRIKQSQVNQKEIVNRLEPKFIPEDLHL